VRAIRQQMAQHICAPIDNLNAVSFYDPGISTPGVGYQAHGIWIDGIHDAKFRVLECPSDPTWTQGGLVWDWWGSTSYLANYNAWTRDNPPLGTYGLPVTLSFITDGVSNTVLFGEGYSFCDDIGRLALYSWYYHNFGLDWYQTPNTFLFQDRPLPLDYANCPPGQECCDHWRAQSGHVGGMNVALMDGSVRFVKAGISQATWTSALLPNDGTPLGSDW
jgi:prepilin-type processing-associated H-X9-DG protein